MCKVLIDNQEFATIKDAADFLEVTPAFLSNTLEGKDIMNVNGFAVQRIGIKRKFRKLICVETKEVFNTITDLSNKIGVGTGTISNELASDNVFHHNGKSYYRLSDKSELSKKFVSRKSKRHVTVICKQTGEIFESIKTLADKLGISSNTICVALLKNKIFRRNGLSYIKYIPEQPKVEVIAQAPQPIQHVLDIVVPESTNTSVKENTVEIIKNLTKQNIDSGQYDVVKALIEVLEKLENKTINVVNN